MKLHLFYPDEKDVAFEALSARLCQARAHPFSLAAEATFSFAANLSARLLADPALSSFPEAASFAFWLRPSSLETLKKELWIEPENKNLRRGPAGVVFLMPPSNVSTLFAYTAVLSLLCGNATLVRLPSTPNATQTFLLNHLKAAFDNADPLIQNNISIVGYGHDDDITTALSSLADLRVIWGADETVSHIAALPLQALARHISFGDRFSAAAVGAQAYLDLTPAARDDLARHLAGDLYTFDQLACSSPRALFWIGSDDKAIPARLDFYPRLAQAAQARGYDCDAGKAIARRNAAFLALHDLQTLSYMKYGPLLEVISLSDLAELEVFKSVSYGFGLLLDVTCPTLEAVLSSAGRRDQTLGLACVPDWPDVRGYDRLVPIGRALDFDVVWDGIDLIVAMTRLQRRGG